MKEVIRERFPKSNLIRDEQISAMDGKIRYFKPLRIKMFEFIYDTIRKYSNDVFIYFCMEDKKTWKRSFDFAPKNSNHLDYLFAKSIYNRYPDLSLTKPDYQYYQSF
jgi:spore photoproduct lyase